MPGRSLSLQQCRLPSSTVSQRRRRRSRPSPAADCSWPPAGMDSSKRGTGAVAGLPDDALVEILSRVPAKSLCRFKCVSKAWRDLIVDPHLRKKLPQAMEGLFFVTEWHSCHTCFDVRHLNFVDLTARTVPPDIATCFSVLTGLPEMQTLVLVDSCNGLMLLEHRPKLDTDDILGYIVFNPTTKQWGTAPTCGHPIGDGELYQRRTYLAFDPAISSHFHLVQFEHWYEYPEDEKVKESMSVHAYSSETVTWSHGQTNWDNHVKRGLKEHYRRGLGHCHAFIDGMLQLLIWNEDLNEHLILAVDMQGYTQRMISLPVPAEKRFWGKHTIARSQGLLHDICLGFDANNGQLLCLSVWVLQDYDAKEWVRKDLGCLPKLVGKLNCLDEVAMHQDCNAFLFVNAEKLIAYDMDHKEESVFTTSGNKRVYEIVTPYVPYFADSPALTNRA